MTSSYETIGRPVGRAEGPAKVMGQAIFPADVNLPGRWWVSVCGVRFLTPRSFV
ncbi:MAG: hypothetical protein CM1200mP27_04540 [Chloroflexota bacterium]|nr:MAG: hypothetical protein CM1200mP27_04540 [Chloroflexota bacterium]